MSNEQKINPSQAASLALNTITSQIRLLADMPADSCKMAVAGLEPLTLAAKEGLALLNGTQYSTAYALAGLFEIGWPIGFKLTEQAAFRILGWVVAVVCMGLSGWLLWLAQKHIPIGTAYAVWTGIGGAGTFLMGVLFFGDALSVWRTLGVCMIVGGVITLKLAH